MPTKSHDGGPHGGQYEKAYELSDTFSQQLDFFERVMNQWERPARNLLELRMEYETSTLTAERVAEIKTIMAGSMSAYELEPKFFTYLEKLLRLKKPGDAGVADNIDLQDGYYGLANQIGTERMADFRRFVERCAVYDENLREHGTFLQPGQRLGKRKAVTEQTFFESLHWMSDRHNIPDGVKRVIQESSQEGPLTLHSDFLEYPDLASFKLNNFTLSDIKRMQSFYSVENFAAPYFFGILCLQGKSLEEIKQIAEEHIPFRPETFSGKYIAREVGRLVAILNKFGQIH